MTLIALVAVVAGLGLITTLFVHFAADRAALRRTGHRHPKH
jgi:hypothetical protein